MKKRMIAIVLAAALVAGGLGGFAYAAEPVNEVHAHFTTGWEYWCTSDTFANREVPAQMNWCAHLTNEPDDTGAPVTDVKLALDSDLQFEVMEGENLIAMGPPTYEWSFDDVPEGCGVGGGVWHDVSATFIPGFDASCSPDKTVFTEPATQRVTITVTPKRQEATELIIVVVADEDELVNAVITSPATDESQGIWLEPDGHYLSIEPPDLQIDKTWTTTVTIEVTPKVPEVWFVPTVTMSWYELVDSGTTSGSFVSHPVGEPGSRVGMWTWRVTGDYFWSWEEGLYRQVGFPHGSRVNENEVGVDFFSNGHYAVPGDTFTNDEVTGSSEWAALVYNDWDETGAPLTALTLTLDSELEFDRVEDGNLVTMGPPAYEWSFGALPQGSQTYKNVRFLTPDPFPVTFTPGFDASRTLDKTMFLQSEGTQTQTLTITVTPREAELLGEYYGWFIVVGADHEYSAPDEYDLVDAVIPGAGEDGHLLIMGVNGLELDKEWTTTFEIQVTPKVPQVEFMPCVRIFCFEYIPFATSVGSSVSYPVDGVGTWMWSAEGSYVWHGDEVLGRSAEWQACYREIVNIPPVAPPTPEAPINWPLIGGIIAGCLAAGLLGYFRVWRKHRASKST